MDTGKIVVHEQGTARKIKLNLDAVKISQHAKERYAKRIMSKEDVVSISVFVQNHEEKIKTDITKMLQYGHLIFIGRQTGNCNQKEVAIFLNGSWVVILDLRRTHVITLFSVESGLGKQHDKERITSIVELLTDAQKRKESVNKEIASRAKKHQFISDSMRAQSRKTEQEVQDLLTALINKHSLTGVAQEREAIPNEK